MQPVTEKCRVRVGSWKYTMTLFFRPPLFFSFSPVYTVIWREIRIMFGFAFSAGLGRGLIYKRIWVKGSQKRFAALFKKGCARWSGESKENELFFKDYSTVSLSLSIRVGQRPSTSERPPFDTTAATTSTVLKVVQKLGDASTSRKSPETFLVRQESELPASRH